MSSGVDREAIRQAARESAPDQYLSALLAPRPARADLVTFAAFTGEMHRVPLVVGDPKLGAIRLQWWRDGLSKPHSAEKTGNPVCDAVIELAARRGVTLDRFISMIDAASYLFGSDVPDTQDLESYFTASSGNIFRVSAELLGVGSSKHSEALLASAAGAYGRALLARDLVRYLSKGRMPLPPGYFGNGDPRQVSESDARTATKSAIARLADEARHHLEAARKLLNKDEPCQLLALLPLTLVEPYFAALQAAGRDNLREIADISPFSRAMKLGLARWGRRI